MRLRRTSHRFRRLCALTLLSVLALLPLSVQFHAFHHGHGPTAFSALLQDFGHSDHAHDHSHSHAELSQAKCAHSGPEHGAVQASELTDCDICDLFVTRAWLHLESPAHNLLTGDSALEPDRFESRLAAAGRLYRSRSPPA